jgi:hypothetical protein
MTGTILFRLQPFALVSSLFVLAMSTGCEKPTDGVFDDPYTNIPVGTELVFSEGFEDDLMQWEDSLFVLTSIPTNYFQYYPRMRITNESAHRGMYSLTSDSNKTALFFRQEPRWERNYDGLIGIQFFIMAEQLGGAHFSLLIGQSVLSGLLGLEHFFGIGFSSNDSIRCFYYSIETGMLDTNIALIKPGNWYKCNIEIEFSKSGSLTYYLDGVIVYKKPIPKYELYGIDRILVLRGEEILTGMPSIDGPKQYYIDDIAAYIRKGTSNQ